MLDSKLEQLVVSELEALGFECVKLEIVGTSNSPVVRLYIDKPGGVGIDDCSLVSRTVGLLLEKDDPFSGRYLLEVSSPGSNRPLVKESHFQRFEGEMAKVQVSSKPAKLTYTGLIRSCINGVLTLDTGDDEAVEIELPYILKASLIGQDYKIDKKTKTSKREKRAGRARDDGRSAPAEHGRKRKGDQK
ncbi:MAG: ribosome maturation factor RimP [Candidatus Krumholzibacteria bacterium]|nr:ribosome maturation factor RimP [Candidatus Krumholzibacteria bacterium]